MHRLSWQLPQRSIHLVTEVQHGEAGARVCRPAQRADHLALAFLTPVHALADRVWQDYGGSMDRYEFWGRWIVLGCIGAAATNYWPHGLLVPIATGISILAVAASAGLLVEHPVAFADGRT